MSSFRLRMVVDETMALPSDEGSAVLRTSAGDAVAERYHRSGPRGGLNVATDDPGTVSAVRRDATRADNFTTEQDAARAFINWHNRVRTTNFVLQDKVQEDSDVDDAKAKDTASGLVMRLQITHLDSEIAGKLGRDSGFNETFQFGYLPTSIERAIAQKALIDPDVKRQQTLLLLSAVPLGEIARRVLSAERFELRGYREVWVFGLGGEALLCQSAL